MQVLLLTLVALLAGSLLYMLSRQLLSLAHKARLSQPSQRQATVPTKASQNAENTPPLRNQAPDEPESPGAARSPGKGEPAPVDQRLTKSTSLSRKLNKYLHTHKLPHVEATVFINQAGRAGLVKLSGEVRTEKGKEDAEFRSQEFFGSPSLRIQARIEVNPSLGSTPESSFTSTEPPSVPESTSAPDPCSSSCRETEDYCKKTCINQSAGNMPSLPGLNGLLQQLAPGKQCFDDCDHALHQCLLQCGPSGGPDYPSEGPDHPPE